LPRKETKISSLVTQTGALELLDLSPLPIFTYEKRENDIYIRYANRACHNTFSEGKKSLLGKPIHRLVMLEDEEEMLSACLEALDNKSEKKENKNFFIRSRAQDGTVIKLMCVTSVIKWLNEHIGICFVFDVSSTEDKYAKMNANVQEGYMGTLVAGIVHDFRNVLTSIIGTAEALQYTTQEKSIQDQLEVIIGAGERGSETITHLLKLSSREKAKEKLVYTKIKPTLQNITALLRIQLSTKIKLQYNFADNLPKVKISTSHLEQILMNLVNNASQAIENEGVISISAHKEVNAKKIPFHKGETLCISVKDSGCGIAEEHLAYVTENFWSLRKDKGGTGLGLAMVKRVIQNNGGKLEIISKLGAGTQINIYLPAEDASEQHKTETPPITNKLETLASKENEKTSRPSPVKPENKTIPCTILLVDDQPEVLQVHMLLLQAMGHKVLTATHGAEAIEVFKANKSKIQMLVTDFKMPGMDGIDLAEALRKESANLTMLMVTAFGETEKLKLSKNLNMDIILKPSNFKKLSDAIAKIQDKNPETFS
jgi:signal transduction histidine kinase/ActR/RegA family two-component response regulator